MWIRVAGYSNEPRHVLVAQLQQLVQHAPFCLYAGQVFFRGEGMYVDKIDVLDLQCGKALLYDSRGLSPVAIAQLRRQKRFLLASLQYLAYASFAQVIVAVVVRSVNVSDPEIERLMKGFQCLLFLLIHRIPAATTHGKY